MATLNIARLGLPGALFNSAAAIETCGPDARAYESAVANYDTTRCDITLWEELSALGFDPEKIEWHRSRPGS